MNSAVLLHAPDWRKIMVVGKEELVAKRERDIIMDNSELFDSIENPYGMIVNQLYTV